MLGKNVYVFLIAGLGVYMCPRCTFGNALWVSDRGVVLPTMTAVLSAVPRDADNFPEHFEADVARGVQMRDRSVIPVRRFSFH